MAQPAAENDEELRDELQLQEIILESLAGTPEDTPQRRAEIEAEIVRVKILLKKLQVTRQKQDSRTNDAKMAGADEPPGAGSISGVSFHGRNLWDQTGGNENIRKRTYSTHLDNGQPAFPDSKSQRTTPSGVDEEFAWEAELFGNLDDGDGSSAARRAEYEQRELAYRQKQAQEEVDAQLARRYQEEEEEQFFSHNGFDSPGTSRGRSGHQSQSEPNPIDRLDRYQNRPIDSATSDGFLSQASSQPPSEPRTTRMPGAWETDDSGDMNITNGQPSHGFVPASSAGNVHPSELARHATIQRQRFGYESPIPGSLPGDASFQRRPGSIVNGVASPLAYGTNNSVYRPGTSTLAQIVQRTNNYNYDDGTDEYGDPLDDRIILPFRYDADGESEHVKALLANISTESDTSHSDQDFAATPPALKEPLYKHQQIALKWMKAMEADVHKSGGILADDMGLGKTISTLALMVHDRVPSGHFGHGSQGRSGTNVVVAPVSLIRQWEKEIATKLKFRYSLEVHNYHKKKLPYLELRKFDVVLTSYGKIGMELKALDAYTKARFDKGEQVDRDVLAEKFPFICAKEPYLRLILDESQCIKNKNAQMHKAVCRIPAKYRWCLSGTPMMNNVDEMGSLIHFLRIKPYNDPKEFKQKFHALYPRNNSYEDPSNVMKKLQVLLRAIMLRRTKTSTIDGAPIITLPTKTEVTDHVIFTDDEKAYYDELEKNARVEFNKYLRGGTMGKNYSAQLVKLLRLRQACCHPYLHITDLEFTNNEISEKEMTTLAKEIHSTRVDALKEEEAPFDCPICYEPSLNPSILVPCGHYACYECLQLHTNSSEQQRHADNEAAKSKCIICRAEFDMKKTITYQVFKGTFMPETISEADSKGDDDIDTDADTDFDSDDTDSAEDGDDIDERGNLKDFIVDDDDDGDYVPVSHKAKGKGKGKGEDKSKSKGKGKGKKKSRKEDEIKPHMLAKLRKDATRNIAAHKKYSRYLHSIFLSSAKISKCVEVLEQIQESDEKTIVFSQWTLLLDLLEVPLKYDLKLQYRRYDGSMSAKQRDDAVQEFTEKPETKVLLTSLKAGNAGLNLICATRVIIMDPFWNPFIEKQAVDRTYRIGQRNPVQVHRILVKGTVEDRIMDLQEQKRQLVEGAMDEGAAMALSRLSHNDLAYLFGASDRR